MQFYWGLQGTNWIQRNPIAPDMIMTCALEGSLPWGPSERVPPEQLLGSYECNSHCNAISVTPMSCWPSPHKADSWPLWSSPRCWLRLSRPQPCQPPSRRSFGHCSTSTAILPSERLSSLAPSCGPPSRCRHRGELSLFHPECPCGIRLARQKNKMKRVMVFIVLRKDFLPAKRQSIS